MQAPLNPPLDTLPSAPSAAGSRIRIVLVGTQHPGNIGSAARAMKTMGLSRLVLVAPQKFPHNEADMMAAGADDVLASALVVETLADAVADCRLVLGCTARSRRVQLRELDPRMAAASARADAEAGGEVALVFGRERTGLENTELQLCHAAVHIPANPDYSSLNLAAAVQVLTYEVRMAWLAAEGRPTKVEKLETTAMLDAQPVTVDELENYFGHLEQTLVDIGFLDPAKPRHLMPRLRRLYGRSGISKLEMNILRGILTETQKAARGEPHKRRSD